PDPPFWGESERRKQPLRWTIARSARCLNSVQPERAEPEIQHQRSGFSCISVTPVVAPNGVTELATALTAEPDSHEADQHIDIVGDDKIVVGAGVALSAGNVIHQAFRLVFSTTGIEAERAGYLRIANNGHRGVKVGGTELA